ncbi:hypothetical protein P692DRAFT_20714311, partial [Suillus brevipes Sb2]
TRQSILLLNQLESHECSSHTRLPRASRFLSGLRSEYSNPPRPALAEPSCATYQKNSSISYIPKILCTSEEGENASFERRCEDRAIFTVNIQSVVAIAPSPANSALPDVIRCC